MLKTVPIKKRFRVMQEAQADTVFGADDLSIALQQHVLAACYAFQKIPVTLPRPDCSEEGSCLTVLSRQAQNMHIMSHQPEGQT